MSSQARLGRGLGKGLGYISKESRDLLLSLITLVPNSRDRHEKQWRPDFARHKTHPKIRFV